MVGKRFFRSQVTDMAWTPDGYTLLAASSDGRCQHGRGQEEVWQSVLLFCTVEGYSGLLSSMHVGNYVS